MYELNAFVKANGQRKPFYLKITAPVQTAGASDYYCRVHAPAILRGDKNIYGVDAEQAKVLALEFIKSLIGDSQLVDEKDRVISL